jgi:hypothetical protein
MEEEAARLKIEAGGTAAKAKPKPKPKPKPRKGCPPTKRGGRYKG